MKLILVHVLVILIHSVDSSNVHYITPLLTTHDQYPAGESCLTLATLATANSREYFNSNTILVFLEGSHISRSSLVVSNINGTLLLTTNGSSTAAIISGHGSLEFSNITQLRISGLEFNYCSVRVKLVNQFILEDSRFYGGSGYSALRLNSTNTSIVRNSFVSNTAGTYQSHVSILEYIRMNGYRFPYPGHNSWSTSARVGGALFVTSSTVNINSSHFESNTAIVGGAIFLQLRSNIAISNSTFVNNSATNCSTQLGCLGGAIMAVL